MAVAARRKDRLDALAAEIGGLAIETDVTERGRRRPPSSGPSRSSGGSTS